MDFSDKVVLVTGASSGIGEDAAIGFAKAGAKVVLVGRDEIRLNTVADKIKSNGSPTPLAIVADVSKDAQKIIDQTIQHFGRVHVLVNNAGIARFCLPSTMDLEQYDTIFTTNCRAPVELTKLAVPHLEKTKGNVVNISSIGASMPIKELTSYCMAKAALDMYTKCASLELAPKGIRVNTVSPGAIITPIFGTLGVRAEESKQMMEMELPKYPVGRLGQVADTTNAILFVANEKTSFINGTILVVDGGRQHA